MLQLSWNATTVLEQELRQTQEAKQALVDSYSALNSEHHELRELYVDLGQEFNQCRSLLEQYPEFVQTLQAKLLASEEEKHLMKKTHREALEVAADRISQLQCKIDGVQTQLESTAVPDKRGKRRNRARKARPLEQRPEEQDNQI